MRFTWDAAKSERNLADRGFDFAFATLVFGSPTLERIDTRQDYGEVRRVALGIADGILLTVVYPIGLKLATSYGESYRPE